MVMVDAVASLASSPVTIVFRSGRGDARLPPTIKPAPVRRSPSFRGASGQTERPKCGLAASTTRSAVMGSRISLASAAGMSLLAFTAGVGARTMRSRSSAAPRGRIFTLNLPPLKAREICGTTAMPVLDCKWKPTATEAAIAAVDIPRRHIGRYCAVGRLETGRQQRHGGPRIPAERHGKESAGADEDAVAGCGDGAVDLRQKTLDRRESGGLHRRVDGGGPIALRQCFQLRGVSLNPVAAS